MALLLVSCCGFRVVWDAVNAVDGRWFLLAAPLFMGLLVATFIGLRRDEQRKRLGLCPTCGYDCRGPADGTLLARCPECGTDLARTRKDEC